MGSFVAPMPAGSLNVALSNYAKEFRNNALVGDLVAPRVPVARQSFQYVVWNRDDLRLPGGAAGAIVRAPGNRPMSVRRSYSTSPYMCVSHALEAKVPYESEAYGLGLGFSTKQALTKQLINQINLDREVAIANSILNLTNFPNGTTLSGAAMWDNYGGASHPIVVVEGLKAELRQAGIQDSDMVLILSDPVRVALSNHPDLIDRFKYTNISGAITLQQMESVFGVKCVQASAIWIDKGNNASYAWGTSAVPGVRAACSHAGRRFLYEDVHLGGRRRHPWASRSGRRFWSVGVSGSVSVREDRLCLLRLVLRHRADCHGDGNSNPERGECADDGHDPAGH